MKADRSDLILILLFEAKEWIKLKVPSPPYLVSKTEAHFYQIIYSIIKLRTNKPLASPHLRSDHSILSKAKNINLTLKKSKQFNPENHTQHNSLSLLLNFITKNQQAIISLKFTKNSVSTLL